MGARGTTGDGRDLETDVLVVGSGIAGTTAALAAAREGAHVTLSGSGPAFSGSSSFGGTWGLGLVGPRDAGDAADLVDAVCEVGRGVAVRPLAEALVRGVRPAVEELARRGVQLRRAGRADERDYVPCFDRSHRSWHGIVRESYRTATLRALAETGVGQLCRHDLLGLATGGGGRVVGATLLDRAARALRHVRAGAVVLATGGLGGLYGRTLTTADVSGTGAAMALGVGARLVNVEFVQIMAGLVSPVQGVVLNERTLRYAQVEGFGGPGAQRLLDARSGHGPFSASLPDRVVDLAIVRAGARGAAVTYRLPDRLPEFMQTYFDWFEGAFGRSPARDVRVVPYAHASNGGILVDERGWTGVAGLFAAGEAAGSMHGADRIGGLASANALVGGHAAGRAAAAWAMGAEDAGGVDGWGVPGGASPEAAGAVAALRRTMDERCLLPRDEAGLGAAATEVAELAERLDATAVASGDATAVADTAMARHALTSAQALVAAMAARRESRGAHYRADFPHADEGQARPLEVLLDAGRPRVRPLGGLPGASRRG